MSSGTTGLGLVILGVKAGGAAKLAEMLEIPDWKLIDVVGLVINEKLATR